MRGWNGPSGVSLTALIVPHWDNLRRAMADRGSRMADSMSEDDLERVWKEFRDLQREIEKKYE